MNPSHEPAPLVALTDEEAAQTMISEGGPPHQSVPPQPPTASHNVTGWLCQQAEAQFYSHPLTSILIAFGAGVIIGAAARKVS
ncbi:hypothetical protein [Verrucomicrobium spinosum]|uniref:hypothetical protein n=1 Tax=Verrucomicrobium spinosum TaxID=2736 RepID=UPI0001745B7A|nr:hypothetical protein [Verrucomicrobium spinosum]